MVKCCRNLCLLWVTALGLSVQPTIAQPFLLPTANHALFEAGGDENFFAPTPGKPWTSGCFGCVRSSGNQLHEGLDIRSIQRDKRDEPTDPVMAAADGTVAYINRRASLSNYGNYVVLRHQIDGLEVYTLYAHLKEVRDGLKVGQTIKAHETIATMGRTSNTAETIGKERAHVHFEIDLFLNDRFAKWYKENSSDQRNDHGAWNGQNLLGLDPRQILLQSHNQKNFNLRNFVFTQTPLCHVFVRATDFPWLRRYPQLIRRNVRAEKEGVVGYEIAINFNGVPYQLTPRAASEIPGGGKFQLLSVNQAEQSAHPCRHLVTNRNGHWELTTAGNNLLALLVY